VKDLIKENKLKGLVAVITGAGSGIGKAISLRLARDGAIVVVCDINYEAAVSVLKEIEKKKFKGLAIKVDVTNSQMIKEMLEKTVGKFKKIDILVANAGIIIVNRVEQIAEEEWDRVMNVNLKGVFLTNKAVIPYMKKNGGGKIINCSSIAGIRGGYLISHYSASKYGVIGFSQSIAREVSKYNITVNVYCPGVVDTPMWDYLDKKIGKNPGELTRKNIEETPLGRLARPEDVAGAVSFLASKDADFITGQLIVIDGGKTA